MKVKKQKDLEFYRGSKRAQMSHPETMPSQVLTRIRYLMLLHETQRIPARMRRGNALAGVRHRFYARLAGKRNGLGMTLRGCRRSSFAVAAL